MFVNLNNIPDKTESLICPQHSTRDYIKVMEKADSCRNELVWHINLLDTIYIIYSAEQLYAIKVTIDVIAVCSFYVIRKFKYRENARISM